MSGKSARLYDVTLGAAIGASQRLDAAGEFVYVPSLPSGLPIDVLLSSGHQVRLYEGQGFEAGETFRDALIVNPNAVAISGSVYIGAGRFQNDRLAGAVRTFDASADKTLAGRQFMGYAGGLAANGCASVKANGGSVAIRRITLVGNTGNYYMFSGTSPGTASAGGAAAPNKLRSGAGSTALMTSGTVVAAGSPTGAEIPGAVFLFGGVYQTSVERTIDLTYSPIIITGTGVFCLTNTAATLSHCNIEFEEL